VSPGDVDCGRRPEPECPDIYIDILADAICGRQSIYYRNREWIEQYRICYCAIQL